jgi:hypothetical protein
MSIHSYFCLVCGRNLFTWKNEDGMCVVCKQEKMKASLSVEEAREEEQDEQDNTQCDVCTYPVGSHTAVETLGCARVRRADSDSRA